MNPQQKFLEINGCKIFYLDWNYLNSKETVICIHGVTRNSRDFDFLAHALALSGFRVIAVDMIGRGESEYFKDYKLYNYNSYIESILEFIKLLNLKSISLIGSSMGGVISMLLASKIPSIIKSIIINDIGPHTEIKHRKVLYKYITQYPKFSSIIEYQNYLRFLLAPFNIQNEKHWQHIFRYGKKEECKNIFLNFDEGVVMNMKENLTSNINLWKTWNNINEKTPILVLRGEKSKILPPETLKKMIENRKNINHIEYKNTGHTPSLMDDDQIEDVKNWLLKIFN